MSFTAVCKAENSGLSGCTSLTVGSSNGISGVQAGDLVVIFAGGGSTTTITDVSDGTSSFTAGTSNTSNTEQCQFWYLLSSVATGAPTYTITYSASTLNRTADVFVFRPSSPCVMDVQRADQNNPNSSAPASGNITTTGTDEMVVFAVYKEGSTTYSNRLINSLAVTDSTGQTNSDASYRAFASTFTGQGELTLSGNTRWCCNIISFKITGEFTRSASEGFYFKDSTELASPPRDRSTSDGFYFIDTADPILYGAAQYSSPNVDIFDGQWFASNGGADLYAMVDEDAADDADSIYTNTIASCSLGMETLVDP